MTGTFPIASDRTAQFFPTLVPSQIERIAQHGHARRVTAGEVLLEAGTPNPSFLVVREGIGGR
jgi:CRP-like cAMP-binding protein